MATYVTTIDFRGDISPQAMEKFNAKCVHMGQLNFKQIFAAADENSKSMLAKFLDILSGKTTKPKKAKYSITTGRLTDLKGEEFHTNKTLFGADEARVIKTQGSRMLLVCTGGELSQNALLAISKAFGGNSRGEGTRCDIKSICAENGKATMQIVYPEQKYPWQTDRSTYSEGKKEQEEIFNDIRESFKDAEMLFDTWRAAKHHPKLSTTKTFNTVKLKPFKEEEEIKI